MTARAGRHMRMVAMPREMERDVRRAAQHLGVTETQFIEAAIARALEAMAGDEFVADDLREEPAVTVDPFASSEDLVA